MVSRKTCGSAKTADIDGIGIRCGDQEDRGLSNVLSEEGARGFLEFCPQSEYVNVTGAAHMVPGDRNDIFLNAVIDFLSRASLTTTRSPRRTREDS